jgi:hypothetical protein
MQSVNSLSISNRSAITYRKHLAVACALAAFTAAGTASAFAAVHHRVTHPVRQLHMYAGESFEPQGDDLLGGTRVDSKRAAAVHECSVAAAKFSNSSWQTAQFATFGTCMTEHGQMP